VTLDSTVFRDGGDQFDAQPCPEAQLGDGG